MEFISTSVMSASGSICRSPQPLLMLTINVTVSWNRRDKQPRYLRSLYQKEASSLKAAELLMGWRSEGPCERCLVLFS